MIALYPTDDALTARLREMINPLTARIDAANINSDFGVYINPLTPEEDARRDRILVALGRRGTQLYMRRERRNACSPNYAY
jgi:hypothetical protein